MPHKMGNPSPGMMDALEADDYDRFAATEGLIVGISDDDSDAPPFVMLLIGTAIAGDRRRGMIFDTMDDVEAYAAGLIQAGRAVFGPQPKGKTDD